MEKKICDVCGKDITDIVETDVRLSRMIILRSFDACHKCQKKIRDYIKKLIKENNNGKD